MKRSCLSLGALLVVFGIAPLHAQGTGSIIGHLTDDTEHRPIAGATITIGSRGAVTKADGSYLINNVRAGTDTVHAKMIGYTSASQVVEVLEGQTVTVDLAMAAQAVNLSEMVVVGYGEMRAGDIIGAVSNVTTETFNTGRIVTPTELIQNKAPGVQVVESNEPGGSTSIRIRGATSTTANSDPLYVVDGIPLGIANGAGSGSINFGRDPLNFLNPDDIESIAVLRDASAAAIYGSNAANGVIIITTKTGKGQTGPKFEYNGSVSGSTVTRLPSMLNAAQFRAAVTQYAPANVAQLGTANTNWFDLIDRTGYGSEQNFALAGAGNSSNYRLSLNVLDQNGILQATNAKRLAVGINYNQLLFKDRLNLKTSVRGSRDEDTYTPGGVLGNAAVMGPTQAVKDSTTATGFYNWTVGGVQSADNPVEALKFIKNNATTYRSIGNVQGAYSLPWVEGLSANLNVGYDLTRARHTTFNPSLVHSEQKNGHLGNYFQENPSQLNVQLESYLSYAVPKAIGPGNLDLTAGYGYYRGHGEFPGVQAESLATDLLGTDGVPAAKTVTPFMSVQDNKLISYYGRSNYNINDKYLASVSIRRDGSSRFGPAHQWGNFPSVALAWRLSEESFLKDKFHLSDLKLRGAWGKTGNQSFGNYLYLTSYAFSDAQAQYWMGTGFVSTIRPTAVDTAIKWEETRSVNLGLDYGFNSQRFSGSIDWYDKKTTDLIFTVPAAAGTVPGDFVTRNIGSMRNRGIEFNLSAKLLQGGNAVRKGLSWTADFTAAHNSNELLTITPQGGQAQQILVGGIAGGVGQTIQILRPGVPINSFYVYKQKYANGKPVEGSYEDLNKDGIVNANDRRPFHDPAPKWIFGHSSYLTYGKFDASFTLRAYTGNYTYNNIASTMGAYSEVTRGSPYNLHSSVLKTGFTTQQLFTDYYVEDASFLRMDNITLGYSFNLRGEQARVFGTLQNAFTITGYSGVDPTAGINGIDNNLYPRSRTFTGGLSLHF